LSFNGNQYPSDEGLDLTTKGQIHTHDTSANAALNVGSNTYLLTADSTESTGMKWAASGAAAPTTTKGDISGFSTTQARIPISTNNYSLFADSAEALGLKWAASPTSTLTTTGDLLASSAPNVLARIAGGASGELLTGNGAGVLPTFQAAAGGSVWTDEGSDSGTASALSVDVSDKDVYQIQYSIQHDDDTSGFEAAITFNGITTSTYSSGSCTINTSAALSPAVEINQTYGLLSAGGDTKSHLGFVQVYKNQASRQSGTVYRGCETTSVGTTGFQYVVFTGGVNYALTAAISSLQIKVTDSLDVTGNMKVISMDY